MIQRKKCFIGSELDDSYSISKTSDGGCVIAGMTESNDVDVSGNQSETSDCWIIKLDVPETIQWSKYFLGTNLDKANSIQQTSDAGYIVAGESYSIDGDVASNDGLADYWIVKLSSSTVISEIYPLIFDI